MFLLRPYCDCVLSYLCVCGSRDFLVVEGKSSVLKFVKATKTIESSSQPGLLYPGLPDYAERETEDRSGDLLFQMAAQANATIDAEAVTQIEE